MASRIVPLTRHLALALLAVLLAGLRGTADSQEATAHRVVFFTFGESTVLDASRQQFEQAFKARHPQLARLTRIEAVPLASDGKAMAQRIRATADTRPALFVAHTGLHAQVVRATAPQVPLVFSSHTDPRELGVVSDLVRHAEVATGLWINDELNSKRLEVLLDAYAEVRVVAALGDSDWYHGIGTDADEMRALAARRGVMLHLLKADSVEQAMALATSKALATVQGWCIPRTSLSIDGRLVRHVSATGRPVITTYTADVLQGAHLSYGYDRSVQSGTLADLAARVLRGESASGIPVQTPDRFELTVRIADDQRLPQLNPAVVRRADRVIR